MNFLKVPRGHRGHHGGDNTLNPGELKQAFPPPSPFFESLAGLGPGKTPDRQDNSDHGDERKLKTRIPDKTRLEEQDYESGEKNGMERAAGSLEKAAGKINHGHDGCAHSGNARARQESEKDDDGDYE